VEIPLFSRRGIQYDVLRSWTDTYEWPHAFENLRSDSGHAPQVFHCSEWRLGSFIQNSLSQFWSDPRELLELLEVGLIHVDWRLDEFFLLGGFLVLGDLAELAAGRRGCKAAVDMSATTLASAGRVVTQSPIFSYFAGPMPGI
jgi:hypothetical protein